jgi:hypothetical protein
MLSVSVEIKLQMFTCLRIKQALEMAPLPLEGHQTPGGSNVPQEGNRGGSISLAVLIDFIIQRTYHELTVLAEL